MAIKKIEDDWGITPTTATENAEAQARMASAMPAETTTDAEEQTEAKEEAPASYMDTISSLWGTPIASRRADVKTAGKALSARAQEEEEARKILAKAKENRRSVLNTLLEEQKPIRKEDEEKLLRNRALVKGFGDVVSAIATGAHAYGKRGAGVVPTLASNSPLKDVEKLNALQKEYLKRKEAWKALDMKIRLANVDAEDEEAQAAYEKAKDRMKDAQKRYDDAVKDYNTVTDDYHKDMADVVAEERKQDRMDARERYRQGAITYRSNNTNKGGNKTREDVLVDAYNDLFPWEPHDVISENYDEWGEKAGYSKRDSKYSEDLPEIKAKARIDDYANAVVDLVDMGYFYEDAVELVRAQYEEDMKAASESFHENIVNKIHGKSK
jgi:hypothetical protein